MQSDEKLKKVFEDLSGKVGEVQCDPSLPSLLGFAPDFDRYPKPKGAREASLPEWLRTTEKKKPLK